MFIQTQTSVYEVNRSGGKYIVLKLAVRGYSSVEAGTRLEADRISFNERGQMVLEQRVGNDFVEMMNTSAIQF